MIPKIIHQVWVGPAPFPDEFREYQKTWLDKHPGWRLHFWTEDNLPCDLRMTAVYDKLRTPAERADILRIEMLWRQGGFYVDTDFECLRCLEPYIEELDFFTAYLKPGRINNAFVGAVAGHPVLDRALKEMRPREYWGYDKAACGPLFLNDLVMQYPELYIFDAELFYPSTPAEREKAIADHHCARSWQTKDGFRDAALRAEQRLEETQHELHRIEKELAGAYAKMGKTPLRLGYRWRHLRKRAKKWTHARLKRVKHIAKLLWQRFQKHKKTARGFWVKKVWRRAQMMLDTRHRSTYKTTLSHVPSRDEIPVVLNERGLNGKAAEIGVKTGKFSEYLLTKWRGAQLISIDPWLAAAPGEYVDRANVPQDQHERFYAQTRERLRVHNDRSDIWRMTSVEAAERVEDHSLDFVYIDARHDYESVLEDLEHWFEKVRPGGILAGHDYADGLFEQGQFGVKSAVDEFFAKRGLPVYSTAGKHPVEMFPSWLVEVPRETA